MPIGKEKAEMRRTFGYTCKLFQKQYKSRGLRIDLQLIDHFTNQERWIDTTCIHPTCASRIKQELKHIKIKIHAKSKQRESKRIDPNYIPREGYAADNQKNFKHKVYMQLINIARKQHQDGRRAKEPVFYAAVATTLGEIGEEFVKLQEFVCSAYGRHMIRQGDRDDRSTILECTTNFRRKFRERIIMAMAKGHARIVNECGLPMQCCKKNSR